jgi:alkanesulfonate monooxygenase SsuD/methylene tetrahydromethanopterin reductase-like flavin-dependent oxidoreductase (luciferase family)
MRDFPGQPDSELSTRRLLERLVIAGTPQSVADRILEFREEVGAFGTLLYTGHDWADPALARRSMELAANEVLPRIHRPTHGEHRKSEPVDSTLPSP